MTEAPFPYNEIWGDVRNLVQARELTMVMNRPSANEIPAPTRFFTDRDELLERFQRHLDGGGRGGYVVWGSGCSALAREFNARNRDRFAASYHLNLRGRTPWEAMDQFLRRHGHQCDPGAEWSDMQSAYNTIIGRDRAIVVVDGAADAETVGLFQPSEGVFYLVLADVPLEYCLEASGVELPELSRADAAELLRRHGLADDAIEAVTAALPLKAGLLADTAVLVAQGITLEDLAKMAGDDREFFTQAYARLPQRARRYYRVLAALDSAEFEEPLLLWLDGELDGELGGPHRSFELLKQYKLVEETLPESWRLRVVPERLDHEDLDAATAEGLRLAVRWMLRRAQWADRAAFPRRTRVTRAIDLECPAFADADAAREWFAANLRTLMRLLEARALRTAGEAVAIAEALWAFFGGASYFDDAVRCYEIGLEAAAEGREAARMAQLLGKSLANRREYDRAIAVLRRSLAMAEDAGDLALVGSSLEFIGRTLCKSGDVEDGIGWLLRAVDNGEREGEDGKGDDRAIGLRLWMLGAAYRDRGEPERALDCFRRSLLRLRRIEDGMTIVRVMIDLSLLELAEGVPGAADRLREAAIEAENRRLWRYAAGAFHRYALVAEPRECGAWLRRAREGFVRSGDPSAAAEMERILTELGERLDGE